MVKRYVRFIAMASVVASVSLLAGGCSSKKVVTDEGPQPTKVSESTAAKEGGRSSESRLGGDESLVSKPPTAATGVLEGRTSGPMLPIYFDFDKSNVRDDQRKRMENNGKFLKDTPSVSIVIEGNCDERGTNEYNMALGERRAMAAKKYLTNLGVADNRLSTISYGEEKPLNHGHDEMAWSQNRRDDFVIK